jgi:hypothetical protein
MPKPIERLKRVLSALALNLATGGNAGFRLHHTENSERRGGTTEMKQATAVGRDVLVVAGTRAEKASKFVIASAEPPRCIEALEAAHTPDVAFDAPVILLHPVILVSAGAMGNPPAER